MQPIDKERVSTLLRDLLTIHSPTGHTDEAINYCEAVAKGAGFETGRTVKGGLAITLTGGGSGGVALSAHVDTLGLMVRRIKENGRLEVAPIGGMLAPSLEGAAVEVETLAGERITGTVLPIYASTHVFGERYESLKRSFENLEVRLDKPVQSAAGTRALGIDVGCFVCVDPSLRFTSDGFVRSRFLDDKAAVAALLATLEAIAAAATRPQGRTLIYVSPYEEVGHGCPAGLPADLEEIIAVDMAAVGEGQASAEEAVTVCFKDRGGPYDHALSQELMRIGGDLGLDMRRDLYPVYASDATAAARAGRDARIALFGPGIDASHTHERTHIDSVVATAELARAFLLRR